MSQLGHKIIQFLLLGFSLFMLCGGGIFWRESMPGGAVQTTTYTLYRSMPPPPVGPRFCPFVEVGQYGLVGPCNFVPPFVWWLEKRYREKNYTIKL